MRLFNLLFCILSTLYVSTTYAETEVQKVKVSDPFLEMHTGPSDAYPIFNVIERNESIEIIKQHTSWFLIKNNKEMEGWVHSSQLEKTLTLDGDSVKLKSFTRENYLEHTGEAGIMGGNFDTLSMMTVYANYALTKNLSAELSASQVLGNFSSRLILDAQLIHQPFPSWRISPYFSLGAGQIKTSVRSTLSQLTDRTDNTANVGLGFKMYLTRRFILRADLKNYFIFQSKNNNEEITSWQLGFAFFF